MILFSPQPGGGVGEGTELCTSLIYWMKWRFDFFNGVFESPFLGMATLRDKSMAKLFNPWLGLWMKELGVRLPQNREVLIKVVRGRMFFNVRNCQNLKIDIFKRELCCWFRFTPFGLPASWTVKKLKIIFNLILVTATSAVDPYHIDMDPHPAPRIRIGEKRNQIWRKFQLFFSYQKYDSQNYAVYFYHLLGSFLFIYINQKKWF